MLDITTAARSDPGQRATNEDALAVGPAGAMRYAVLSDGAGGHERGAEASRRVVERVAAMLDEGTSEFAPQRLAQALLAAHAELQREQAGVVGRRRMHATALVLWIDCRGDRVLWAHVGDSRLYRFRWGKVELLTADDSVVQRMLESGVLTPQQASTHPLRSQLLAAIGMQDDVSPHVPPAAALEDGDAFLLCTDGWWSMLSDAEMTAALSDADTPDAWLDAMHRLIVSRGAPGHDNFSAVAVWACDPAESTQSMGGDEA